MEAAEAESYLVYLGTYTSGDSKGIYCYRMDRTTGEMQPVGVTGGIKNPSFLAIHPDGRRLYSVAEIADFAGGGGGALVAFALDPKTGSLQRLNAQSSGGPGPCHLTVEPGGRFLLAANYGGGSVISVAIEPDGSLGRAASFQQHTGSGVDPRRQQGPHAHSINLDARGRFAYAADLGLDKVLIYRFSKEDGSLAEAGSGKVKPGSGPRHFSIHPGGRWAYVINEMASTVTLFERDESTGALAELQTVSTLPPGFSGSSSTAEVLVHPSGNFLYGSNRGHDSIALFRIDSATGRLEPAGHVPAGGKTPRNFAITPCGRFLVAANQGSNNLTTFRIDATTGALTPTGQVVDVPSPVCVRFLDPSR